MSKIFFVSNSEKKFNEVAAIFDLNHAEVEWYKADIPELQTDDNSELVRKKTLDAFTKLKRPVLVEHTAFKIHAFNSLPGMHTRHFYSKLGYHDIVEYCKLKNDFQACAISFFGYCDGRKIIIGIGEEWGSIVKNTKGLVEGFDWDTIFIPDENNDERRTYAAYGIEKNKYSMRRKAWVDLKQKLTKYAGSNIGINEDITELAKLIKDRKVLLFVGAGISASLGFPSWNDLIGRLGKIEGFEKDLFQSYGDNMMLAEFSKQKDSAKVYEVMQQIFSLDKHPEIEDRLRKSEIYRLLLELNFPIIYTTNYDHLIEKYYEMNGRSYKKIVNIEDMNMLNTSETRIIKFHGDIDDENSIVLSESQYFERMSFQSFLDVQLQADLLQYHVLFLGYSLSDINVKLLLYHARKRWKEYGRKKQAYIFTVTPNSIQKSVFEGNDIISFSGSDTIDKMVGTQKFLEELTEAYKML